MTTIPEYKIEINDLGIGYEVSRQILLIHNSINYNRMKALEPKYIATVIINIKMANNSSFNFISIYRQWKLPKIISDTNNTNNDQMLRYNNFIKNL